MNSTNETLLFDRFLIMYNLCVFTCIIFIFVFHCTQGANVICIKLLLTYLQFYEASNESDEAGTMLLERSTLLISDVTWACRPTPSSSRVQLNHDKNTVKTNQELLAKS